MKAQKLHVGALYQAMAFAVSLVILTTVFYIRFQKTLVQDPMMQLEPVSESAKKIITGVHLDSFSTFDVIKNQFVAEGTIWFAFNADQVSLENIKKFSIVHGTLLKSSDPVIKKHDKETIAQFDVRIEFNTPLNYRLFPIDDHLIQLGITNHFLPDDMVLVSSSSDVTVQKDIYVPGWQIESAEAEFGVGRVHFVRDDQKFDVSKSIIVALFTCKRVDPSIIVNILLTLILILFMSLLTFSTNEDTVLVVSVIIVSLIGYRAVMITMGPIHISYFMLSDYLYLISLSSSVLALLSGIFSSDEGVGIDRQKLFIAAIYCFFVGGCSLVSILL